MSNLSRRIERMEEALERGGASLCPAKRSIVLGLVYANGRTVARMESGEEQEFPTEAAFCDALAGNDMIVVHFVAPKGEK